MDRFFFAAGSLSAFVAVALGAFAAHGLRGKLAPDMFAVFETGVRYQMYHALGLLAVAAAAARWTGPYVTAALARRDHADRRPRVSARLAPAFLGGV